MSITLAQGTQVSINGVSVENDAQAAVQNFSVDFTTNTVQFMLYQGSVSGQQLIPGSFGQTVGVTINMNTGAWTSTNGKSGVLSGAAFNNAVAEFKSDRNLMETFAAGASAIMAGTQVAWT